MNVQGRIYTVVFSFAAAFLFVFILALVHAGLQHRIAGNAELANIKAVLYAMGIPASENENLSTVFSREVGTEKKGGLTYFKGNVDGETVYAIVTQGKGLWGTISIALAVNHDATRIVGLDIVSHNETPGLGGRIDEAWFKDQFRNEQIKADGTITVGPAGEGDADHRNGEFDVITGASLTSRLFGLLVNDGLRRLETIVRGTP